MEISLFTRRPCRSVSAAASSDVSLTSNNRLDALSPHRIIEGDGSKHISVIGHSTSRHAELGGSFGKRFNLDGAI